MSRSVKALIIINAILIVTNIFVYHFYAKERLESKKEFKQIAYDFFNYIGEGNYNKAAELCGPSVLNISNINEYDIVNKISVEKMDVKRLFNNKGYIEADLSLLVKIANNEFDNVWYNVIYDKENKRIISVNYIEPYMEDSRGSINQKDIEDIQSTCVSFISYVNSGNYAEAAKYLSGKSRVDMEKNLESLPKGGIPLNPFDVNIEVVAKNRSSDMALVNITYKTDYGSNGDGVYRVFVAEKLVKCGDKWKIASTFVRGNQKVQS